VEPILASQALLENGAILGTTANLMLISSSAQSYVQLALRARQLAGTFEPSINKCYYFPHTHFDFNLSRDIGILVGSCILSQSSG
jgi:hypothetical protein